MAKLEVLDNAWSKQLGQLHARNELIKSKKVSELIVKMGSVKPEIKRHALEEFLRCS